MKIIHYIREIKINVGTEDCPELVDDRIECKLSYSPEHEELAKYEAVNGEITIEEDGQPEPEPSREEKLEAEVKELKEALNLLLSGVTE